MSLAVRCPHCQHEFVIADVRRDTAAVCPKCFRVFSAPSAQVVPQKAENLDVLEQLCQQIGSSETPVADKPPAKEPGDRTAPRTADRLAAPQPSPPAESPAPGITFSEQVFDEPTWKPIVMGCIVPLVLLAAIIAFFFWYIASRSSSESSGPPGPPTTQPIAGTKNAAETLAEQAIRELLEIDKAFLQSVESFQNPTHRRQAVETIQAAIRQLRRWQHDYRQLHNHARELNAAVAKYQGQFHASRQRFRTLQQQLQSAGFAVSGSSEELEFLIAVAEYQKTTNRILATFQRPSSAPSR